MKTFANILWAILFGRRLALLNILNGIFYCITIIFIPVGLQFFKVAKFSFTPFGYDFVGTSETTFKSILNIIWAIFFGWEYALSALLSGVFFCITIIFIPVGLQYFKLAKFLLLPLGASVEKVS